MDGLDCSFPLLMKPRCHVSAPASVQDGKVVVNSMVESNQLQTGHTSDPSYLCIACLLHIGNSTLRISRPRTTW